MKWCTLLYALSKIGGANPAFHGANFASFSLRAALLNLIGSVSRLETSKTLLFRTVAFFASFCPEMLINQ